MEKLIQNKKLLIVLFVIIGIYSLVMFSQKYPVYYASKCVPNGCVFTGVAAWFDPWDVNVYVSAIKGGQKQGILLKNLYTSEKGKPVIFYPFYTIVGYLFKNCDTYLLFHILSFFTTFFLCVGIFIAAYLILGEWRYSLAALAFVILGEGLGWLIEFHVRSADVFETSFTFKSAVQRPHEAIGVLLYIFSMIFFAKFIETNKNIYNLVSFFSLFLLIVFYPYYLPVYFCVFAFCISFFKVNSIKSAWVALIRNTGIVGIATLVYFIYLHNSNFSDAINENLPKISLISLLLGFGFYLLTYFYSIFRLKRVYSYRGVLVVWITLCIAAAYLPLGFSRFYLRGLFFPLGLLLVFAIQDVIMNKKGRRVLAIICIAIMFSNVWTLATVFNRRIKEVGYLNRWYYLPIGYKKMFDYVSQLPRNGILASPYISNLIPAYTGKKVFFGHPIQTLAYKQKAHMELFFRIYQNFPEFAHDFLKKNNISYVIYGDYEKHEGYQDPVFLKRINSEGNVKIYEVD